MAYDPTKDMNSIFTDNEGGAKKNGKKLPFSIDEYEIVPRSQVISAPVEMGTESFDNKVIEPLKIVVRGHLLQNEDGSFDGVAEIDKMFRNRTYNFYSVFLGGELYRNLILEECPHKRNTEKVDLLAYELVFKEALLVQRKDGRNSSGRDTTPQNSEDSNTRKSGMTVPNPVSQASDSMFNRLVDL